MLTTAPMAEFDEGSSLGTNDSEMVRPEVTTNIIAVESTGEGEEEASLANETETESEWRVVDFDTQSESGLLILDGEEEDDDPQTQGRCSGSGSGIDFSLPGTDSVPTIVDSIDGLPAAPTSASATQLNTEDKSAVVVQKTETASSSSISGSSSGGQGQVTPQTSNKSRLAIFLVPAVVLFLVPTIASTRLYQERNSLLLLVTNLEAEIHSLKEDARKNKDEEALLWNTCSDDTEQTVLLDNCWVTARANIGLGDCASQAKESLLEFSSSVINMEFGNYTNDWGDSFGESYAEKINKSWMLMRDDRIAVLMALFDTNTTESNLEEERSSPPTTGESYDALKSSFFAKMESSGKTQWKDTVKDAKSAFYTIFASSDEEKASSDDEDESDAFDDVVQGITDLLTVAGSLSVAAGEALVAAAVETATAAMELNQTAVNELVQIARKALDEASLTHQVDG